MSSMPTTSYQVTLYSADFRWDGTVDVPSHRRLTDYINDQTVGAVGVNNATSSMWVNESLRELHKIESIAIIKRSTLLIVSHTDMPPMRDAAFERVQKIPFRILIHLPAYTVIGDLSLLPSANWLAMLTAANQEFFPITQASVWRTKTGAQIETDLKLLLVNRQEILALEPKK